MTKLNVLLSLASQAPLVGSDEDRARVVRRIRDSAEVFEENRKDSNGMPDRLIERAAGLIIFPV